MSTLNANGVVKDKIVPAVSALKEVQHLLTTARWGQSCIVGLAQTENNQIIKGQAQLVLEDIL